MFFGLSSFNFTINSSKYFGLDTTNYANLYSTYTYSSNTISNLKLSYYFFVQRSCTGGLYFYNNWLSPQLDDCVNNCAGYDRPNNDNTNSQCLACDKSCLTCSGTTASTCQTCSSSNFRSLSGSAPSTCTCISNYVDIGNAMCATCSSQMTGCLSCSTTTSCTTCISGFTGPPPCTCGTGSIINGYCNIVYGCVNISMINTTQTCINCNSTLLLELSSSFSCVCIFGTVQQANYICLPICGDGYVLAV